MLIIPSAHSCTVHVSCEHMYIAKIGVFWPNCCFYSHTAQIEANTILFEKQFFIIEMQTMRLVVNDQHIWLCAIAGRRAKNVFF